MSDNETAREAAERNAKAVQEGNITQVMADITPEALAQMMQMGAEARAAGIATPATMPGVQSYTIEPVTEGDDEATYNVTFVSAAGTVTVATTWRLVLGRWKVAAVALVSANLAQGAQATD